MLTPDMFLEYRTSGAVLIKNHIKYSVLTELSGWIDEIYHSSEGHRTRVQDNELDAITTVLDYVSAKHERMRSFISSGSLAGLAATLMGSASSQLILDQIFYKRKGPIMATPWHQDTPFLRVRGDELVRLWCPIDPSPRELTVQVVRGSHRWNVVYNTLGETASVHPKSGREAKITTDIVGDMMLPKAPDVRKYKDSFDVLSWDVEPGDILAFHGNILHGTDGCEDYPSNRRALAVLYGGPNLQYYKPTGKAFPSPGRVFGCRKDDIIPSGAPISQFSTAFPVCWQKSTS